MRKLASLVEIDKILPIEGADKIEVATMVGKGWKVVVAKDEFKPGDLAVYFEIDSYLPADDERYAFLSERCLRKFVSKSGQVIREGIKIKTIKLRGQVSQGLLIPVEKFIGADKEIQYIEEEATPYNCVTEDGKPIIKNEIEGMSVCCLFYTKPAHENEDGTKVDAERVPVVEGTDLTALLRVEHYDEVKESLAPVTGSNPISADAMGKFPSDWIPKTDEERIQNLTDYFDTMKGRKFEVTEKNDGTSVTMFYSPTIDAENPFGVCSRNLRLKPETADGAVPLAWQIAKKLDVEAKIKAANGSANTELAFQGELVGPGINKNRDGYKDFEWHIFKVYDIKAQKFLLPSETRFICKAVGLEHVPVIEEEKAVFDEFTNVDDLLKYAEGKTAHGNEREGLVFKSVDEPYRTFKAVSNRYLIKVESKEDD